MANPSTGSLQIRETVCAATAGAHRSSPGDLFCNRSKRKRESSDGSRINRTTTHEAHCRSSQAVVSSTWKLAHHPMTAGVVGLHKEIEAFVDWIVPNEAEHYIRLSVIERIRATIHEVYPDCYVQIFGSFRTGLYLPTSDIDLVLIGNWDQIPFDVVSKGIEMKNIAKPGTLQLLEHATVPIIKLTDHLTNIKVDISFNMTSGLKAVQLINFFKSHYPAMAKLIYVLKQFLLQRDLNEVYTGGLSSYALILMVVSFLQLHLRSDARTENPNLAVLLMEFFELYGRHFNYTNIAISVVKGGAYLTKDEVRNSMTMGLNQGFLCIQDPYNPENDVGRSSYGIPVVKTAFEKAYLTLSKLVLERTDGILDSIIQVSDEIVNIRNWAKTTFSRGCLPVFRLDNDIDEPQSQSFLEDLLLPPCDAQDRKCDECQVNGTNQGSTNLKSDDLLANPSAANSSDSASSQADTDFDEFQCGSGRALSPSGSSSSMSVSPPPSEAGSEANAGESLNTHSTKIKGPEKKHRFFPVGFSRNERQNGEGKNECDEVLDWRKDCMRQEECTTKPSNIGVSRSQKDQLNSEKPKGGEMQLNKVKSTKANTPLSAINTGDGLSKPPKMDKRSDVAILNRDVPLEPSNETPDRLSGCNDENFRIKTSKKKRRNQNKSWQSQTKNVDLNGLSSNHPVKSQTQSTTNNDHSTGSGSLNSAIKQDKKRSNKEAQPKQPKKDQPPQPQDQSRNHTRNRFSSRAGQSKPKR